MCKVYESGDDCILASCTLVTLTCQFPFNAWLSWIDENLHETFKILKLIVSQFERANQLQWQYYSGIGK